MPNDTEKRKHVKKIRSEHDELRDAISAFLRKQIEQAYQALAKAEAAKKMVRNEYTIGQWAHWNSVISGLKLALYRNDPQGYRRS